MPIYEYACKKCGKTIEEIQNFSDPPLRKHKGCGGTLTKLISASSFQLKGTGWYVTDYAKKSGGGSDSKESKDSKDSSTATAAASEGASKDKKESSSSTPAAAPVAAKAAKDSSKKSNDS